MTITVDLHYIYAKLNEKKKNNKRKHLWFVLDWKANEMNYSLQNISSAYPNKHQHAYTWIWNKQ